MWDKFEVYWKSMDGNIQAIGTIVGILVVLWFFTDGFDDWSLVGMFTLGFLGLALVGLIVCTIFPSFCG